MSNLYLATSGIITPKVPYEVVFRDFVSNSANTTIFTYTWNTFSGSLVLFYNGTGTTNAKQLAIAWDTGDESDGLINYFGTSTSGSSSGGATLDAGTETYFCNAADPTTPLAIFSQNGQGNFMNLQGEVYEDTSQQEGISFECFCMYRSGMNGNNVFIHCNVNTRDLT